jgi:ornithine cyclodeaminase/alanine dehydrogenase
MPPRASISLKDEAGWFAVMPAHLSGARALATKIVSAYARNETSHGLPNVLATVVLNDVETGLPTAIMEGSYITAMRKGAVSGVATKYLARENSEALGIIGAGVQARKQLEAISEVRNIKTLSIYDTDTNRAQAFVAEASEHTGLKASLASKPDELVRSSDIIATATTSSNPVFSGHDIKPGTHVNAIGAYTPTAREVDDETVSSSKIVVDSLGAALSEAGDVIIPLNRGIIQREGILELGDVITGRKPGRTSAHEKTFFKSVGLGIQDAAVAKLTFEKAKKAGIGASIDLD